MTNFNLRRLKNRLMVLVVLMLASTSAFTQGLRDVTTFPVGSLFDFYDVNRSGDTAKYYTVLNREFNFATIGTLDWYNSHNIDANTYTFEPTDRIMKICEANQQRVHGDHLVWYLFANEYVNWLRNFNGTDSAFKAITKDHITTIVSRYKGRVASYNAVNEAFEDNGTVRKANSFYTKIGPGYIDSSFIWARAADPSVKLFLNDYNLESSPAKLDSFVAYARSMKARGIPIDGVGTQLHITVTQPNKSIDDMFKKLAATDMLVMITELDVPFFGSGGDLIPNFVPSEAEKKQQAEKYRYVVESYYRNVPPAQRYALVVWAFTDKVSWIRDFFTGKYEYPCLFDDAMDPKVPVYDEFKKGLQFLTNKELPGRFQSEEATLSGATIGNGTYADQTKQVTIKPGNSVTFPVTISKAGVYPINYRVFGKNASFRVSVDNGTTIPFTLPNNNNGYYNFPQNALGQVLSNQYFTVGNHSIKITGISGSFALNWIESATKTNSIPAKIQAEDYDLQSGLELSSPRIDDDGTVAVTKSDNNDFANYTVFAPTAGNYIFNFRIANSGSTVGNIDIRKNAITKLTTLSVEPTGGDGIFVTVQANIALEAGLQTIQVQYRSPKLSMNWINIKDYVEIPRKVEAEAYSTQTGTQLNASSMDSASTASVSLSQVNSKLTYKVLSRRVGKSYLIVRAKGTGSIQLQAGTNTASIDATDAASWKTYVTTIDLPADLQTIEIVNTAGSVNLNWFSITPYTAAPGITEAEDYSNERGVKLYQGNNPTPSLAYLQPNDFAEYLVDVKTTGTYIFSYRVKGYVNLSTIKLQYNDLVRIDTVTFQNYNFVNVTFSIELTAGIQKLRLSFPVGDVNLDNFEIAENKYYTELSKKLELEKQLPNGKYIIGGLLERAVIGAGSLYGGNITNQAVENQIFTQSVGVTATATQFNYSCGLTYFNEKTTAPDDVLLAVFYARCSSCSVDGKGKITYQIQHGTGFDTYFARYDENSLTSDWKIYYMPFKATEAQSLNQLRVSFLLGYPGQTVEIGGVAMINYEKNITLEQLQEALSPDRQYYVDLKNKLLAEKNLSGGEYVVGGASESSTIGTRSSYGLTSSTGTVQNQIFTQSLQIIPRSTDFSYSAGLSFFNQKNVAANDVLLGVFYGRCSTCGVDGKAKISYQIQHSGGFDTYFARYDENVLTSQWQIFYLPFKAEAAQDNNKLQINFLLGYPGQTIELAGFSIINYKQQYTLADLPAGGLGTAASPVQRVVAPILESEQKPTIMQTYPNPSTGKFTLQYQLQQPATISIIDLNGRLVYMQRLTNKGGLHNINAGRLTSGMYLLKISETGKKMVSSKIQIE
jgi:endo-1,4-beta-xylanase